MAKSKRDDGRYQKNIVVGRKANGRYIRKTIYGKTKKELDLKIAEITQQIHQGIYVPEDKTTFGEMSEIWLTQYNPTANEKWIYRQQCVINRHLLPTLKYMKLKDLKPYHLQTIINKMAKNNLSTSTMKKAKQTAVRILNVGVENDIVRTPLDTALEHGFERLVGGVVIVEAEIVAKDDKTIVGAAHPGH